jgi:hypothetical protein
MLWRRPFAFEGVNARLGAELDARHIPRRGYRNAALKIVVAVTGRKLSPLRADLARDCRADPGRQQRGRTRRPPLVRE